MILSSLFLACFSLASQIGMSAIAYEAIFSDDIVTDSERRSLYENYYTELPAKFTASATWYGQDADSRAEILSYGGWMRQQMWRGWVLIASGEYGYHGSDLLSKQASPLYYYYADRFKDSRGQPVPIAYAELNARQKRIFDLTATDIRERRNAAVWFATIAEQQALGPEFALASGKYIGIVSAKSVNDFGRRFLIYKGNEFVGVVIVGGEAKRDDWTGLGSPTSDVFSFDHFPLIIRSADGDHWAFDLPTSIYDYFGGTGGPVSGIYAVDPDVERCSRKR